MRSRFAHVEDESSMVAEAVLLKSALLAHTLGAAPQTESAPPQQSRAAAHANTLILAPDEETAAHVAASLAALPRQYFQVRSTFAQVKVELPMVVLAALSKSASLAHVVPVTWVPAASATTRRRILGMGVERAFWHRQIHRQREVISENRPLYVSDRRGALSPI